MSHCRQAAPKWRAQPPSILLHHPHPKRASQISPPQHENAHSEPFTLLA